MACSDVTLSRQSKNGMHSPTGHDYSGIDDDIRSNIRTNCMIINESLTFVCGSGSTFLISVSKSICPSALYWSAEAAINRITLNTKVGRRMAIISRKADETELYELETSDLNSNIVTGYRETGSMTRNCAANTILYINYSQQIMYNLQLHAEQLLERILLLPPNRAVGQLRCNCARIYF